jgi:type I restriction enzyme S subunit
MKTEYRKLGEYIRLVDVRNTDLKVNHLLGVSVEKCFIESIANTIGTDFSKYKIVKKRQFTYIPDTSRRGDKIGIALLTDYDEGLVSNIYTVFEVIDTSKLLPEYLMLWFSRPEFDRYARYKSHGSVREIFDWDEMCRLELPIPDIKEQQKIVDTYNSITKRIKIKQKINENLEKTAQCLFNETIKQTEKNGKLNDVATILMGQSPEGDSYNENGDGEIFYQGKSDFGNRFVTERVFTTAPTRIANPNDILLSVRAPVGVINITQKKCCIGRGLAAISSKKKQNSFLFYTLKSLSPAFEIFNGEGTVFGSINREGLENLEIVIPEDNEIMEFEKNASKIDKEIENNEIEISNLQELKQLIISGISKR